MSKAVCLLRPDFPYRRDAFCEGLVAAGYDLVGYLEQPEPGDLMVIWNRYGEFDQRASRFEQAGGTVAVVENGYLGKGWKGGEWFSIALDHHSGAGRWPDGGPSRWAEIGEELAPWKEDVVGRPLVFAQRGIGERGIAAPSNWANPVAQKVNGIVRPHPGQFTPAISLEKQLESAPSVVTWHSAAALQALMLGVPCFHAFDRWIGAPMSQPLELFPVLKRGNRVPGFERLAWSIWSFDEIKEGKAFDAYKPLISKV